MPIVRMWGDPQSGAVRAYVDDLTYRPSQYNSITIRNTTTGQSGGDLKNSGDFQSTLYSGRWRTQTFSFTTNVSCGNTYNIWADIVYNGINYPYQANLSTSS